MSSQPEELKPFLDVLARVAPHPGQLDRDALLFTAGQRAARRGPFWPLTALGFAGFAAGLLVTLAVRPPDVVTVERIVYVPAPASRTVAETEEPITATPVSPDPNWTEGWRLRQRITREGVNALSSTTWAAPPPPADEIPDFSDLRLNAASKKGDWLR